MELELNHSKLITANWFYEDLSLAITRDISLGNARPACVGRLGLSVGIFRLGFVARDPPFKIVRFESCDWKLSLGIVRLGTFA